MPPALLPGGRARVVFPSPRLGVRLRLDADRVVFLRATPESPAYGLPPGLVLTHVDGKPVSATPVRGAYKANEAFVTWLFKAAPRPLAVDFAPPADPAV